MTVRKPTAQEKIAEWYAVYRAILDELTRSEGSIIADRRTAAIAAAMIVAPGGISAVVGALSASETEFVGDDSL